MPDIIMCEGKECVLKETCYRYKAIPTPMRQAYFIKPPFKNKKCKFYWSIEKQI